MPPSTRRGLGHVLGDPLGPVVLSAFADRGRRGGHEAPLCLGLFGLVPLVQPQWPLRVPDIWWWSSWSLVLLACLTLRHSRSSSVPSSGARETPG